MTSFPIAHGFNGHASGHARREERRVVRLTRTTDNSDIRPFIPIGEAASNIVKRLKDAQDAAE